MGTEIQINNIVSEILVSRVVRQCSNNVIIRCCIGSYRLCCKMSDTCVSRIWICILGSFPVFNGSSNSCENCMSHFFAGHYCNTSGLEVRRVLMLLSSRSLF